MNANSVVLWVALSVLILWAMVTTINQADELRAWRMGYCSEQQLRTLDIQCAMLDRQ